MNKKWFVVLSTFTVMTAVVIFLVVREVSFQNKGLPEQTETTTTEESDGFDEAPDLETYRNEDWGFEFQYPEGWTLHEILEPFRGANSKFQLIGTTPEEKVPNTIVPSFLVNVVMPNFADNAAANKVSLGAATSSVAVGSIDGLKYEYIFANQPRISVDLLFGEYRLLFGGRKEYGEVFNQILTSFKFLE